MVLEVNQAIVNESLQTEQVMEQLSSTVDVIVDNIENIQMLLVMVKEIIML